MNTLEKIILVIFTVLIIPFSILLYSVLSSYQINDVEPVSTTPIQKEPVKKPPVVKIDTNQKLPNPPAIIKAVYVTASSIKNQQYLEYLDNLFKTTQINAVVIDIKDYSGQVIGSDISATIQELHNRGIYVIARMVIFEDPLMAKTRPDLAIYDKSKTTDLKNPVLWVDNNNLSWMDPASKEVLEYNIAIAKNAVSYGFDELNFDYIRFPSDGRIENMGFPFWDKKTSMRSVVKDAFKKLRESLPDVKLSVDLFGYATVATDDMGIGQVLEDSFEYFDYISPMVYPSHYRNGFRGYSNPAQYPYEVIKYSMQEALRKQKAVVTNKSKLRPWLQDFNMGADYTADMVKAEIKAVTDVLGSDYNGFMLWNSSNIYTVEAIKLP
ncbi:MAG: hypothetical protein A2904_02020 [Candidatus Staskawiczbacteria bacterium RIFCSPLOWO2_01_FULL_33_9]|uniref:DUF4015 domain-containing protein n=1 Tax=Candidatus Staskawiczbacteria bacterium RIFCSPLOWO2_01_FULL_33_9 TaxID=1802211 RepID=A0A1G2I992_9BACT|nr:MAG: hypothetical protein A2904_02020 [Candidatus Staskawiczbacteria bacterium RIFCSPLOWO2_01_FULL_33_9]